jgi:hypothetical protein
MPRLQLNTEEELHKFTEFAFSIESAKSPPLQSLIVGIFSLLPIRLLHTFRTQSIIYLRFSILTLQYLLCIFWLLATAWIVVSVPLATVVLPFLHYMLFSPLSLTVSPPYFSTQSSNIFPSILCETKLSKDIFLKLFHISSTRRSLLAHIANLSRRKFCGPKTCFVVHRDYVLLMSFKAIVFPFYFQQYPTIITHPLYNTTRSQRTFWSEQVHTQESITSGKTLCYLRVTVFPYQSI